MRTLVELKAIALATLKGKWSIFVLITFIFSILANTIAYLLNFFKFTPAYTEIWDGSAQISASLGFLFLAIFILNILLVLPLEWGYQALYLPTSRTNVEPEVSALFDGFKDYGRITLTMTLVKIYTVLWLLLLIIPGIIKALSYSMTPFVLKDNPEMSGNAAIERSMELMNGHKTDLFILYLSFLGWAILSLFSCGIGFLFLLPYFQMTLAKFYDSLLEDEALHQ